MTRSGRWAPVSWFNPIWALSAGLALTVCPRLMNGTGITLSAVQVDSVATEVAVMQ